MINRIKAIDWMRGLFMVLMALDHTSLYWNEGRMQDEGLQGFYPALDSIPQFLTRFVSHICAPTFLFIAGLMMSLSLINRSEKGQSNKALTLHFIFRGLALIAVDFLIINRVGLTFGILACIGTCMMLLTLIRFLPITSIFFLSISVLVFDPWIDFSWVLNIFPQSSYFIYALSEPIRQKSSWPVFYPVIPWIGVMGLGFYIGDLLRKKLAQGMKRFSKLFVLGGFFMLLIFIPARLFLGDFYGDSSFFWLMSKYPPSLSFLLWNLGLSSILMGACLWWENTRKIPGKLLEILATYGQIPLFFYVLHRYFYGIFPNLSRTRGEYSLPIVYVVWLLGLIPLYFLCREYSEFRMRLKSHDKDAQH
jgi:uncharacterized membrane protein